MEVNARPIDVSMRNDAWQREVSCCAYLVSKKKLTHDAMVETEAHKMASRFIHSRSEPSPYAPLARAHYQQCALPG